jgi:two-component system sensor histidine kinase CiaH
MTMIKKSYVPFAVRVTQFRNKLRTDPFMVAQLQIISLYFIVGAIIFVVVGWFWGYLLRQPLYRIAPYENGLPVLTAIATLEKQLLVERFFMILSFAIAAVFLAEFALRPIRKSADLQKRFVAIVSHELRTPLTIIKNASEVALRNEESLTREKAISILKSNLEETNRLSDTIQFLLTFSTLQNSARLSATQEMSLSDIAKKVFKTMESESLARGINLSLETSTTGLVRGNATALEGLIVNLVKNAIYHTPKKGNISITINSLAGATRLLVADTGHGIAKKDIPYIFKPFFRGENGNYLSEQQSESLKGTGLGLSIVKEVAELHRASVTVHTSEAGSIFTVTFPVE